MEHQHHASHNDTPHDEHENHQGHEGHHDHAELFKRKFFISLVLGIPILILSPLMGLSLPFQFTFPGSGWVVLILATFLYFYGGAPFISGAKDELKQKKPAMMTLITLGISVAYLYSLYAFFGNLLDPSLNLMDFFWELASLILIMLLGHWIEMKAVGNAGDALKKMAELLPNKALLKLSDGTTKSVPLTEVKINDLVIVHAGENIPVDGVVVEGQTTVDEALITGEAKAIEKKKGDDVIGGSSNGNGSIVVKVKATGESGYLSQVMNLVNQAQQEKSHAEALSDKVASALFYVAIIVGLLTFIIWYALTNDLNTSLERLVTVLVIACPHALGLAIPLVVARTTSIGAQNGLLIKNRLALESVPKVNTIMMDKTGTLTEGVFSVNHIVTYREDYSEDDILILFASLETFSSHPLATGILKESRLRNLNLKEINDVSTVAGVGLVGTLNGHSLKIVNAKYLTEHQIPFNEEEFKDVSNLGNSVSYLLIDDNVAGMIGQGDKIKTESKKLIDEIKAHGIIPVMLTGDNKHVAQIVAKQLGIDHVYSELRPEDKDRIIQENKEKKQRVMMIGDGINDAPSLVRADVGVAVGAGTDVAIDSADIILVKSNPEDILHLLSLATNTNRKMKQNLWWGAGYNIFAIPLAAGVLAPIGFILSPAVGAVLMSASTVIVAINAMSLKLK
ncbi:heavy metal translocating P-type ATPase [Vagococcus sp.]|uniref:heavy metal translocating P-type ATPase n=1 Tax=Vagococcus sp. TaxID=1933889 RepID=UPI003F94F495